MIGFYILLGAAAITVVATISFFIILAVSIFAIWA